MRGQYEDGRTKKIAEFEEQAADIRTKLRDRQEEDLGEILEILFEPSLIRDTSLSRRGRSWRLFWFNGVTPHDPLRLLEKAEQCYKTITSPSGMFDIAVAYDDGRGRRRSPARALMWATKSAERGHCKAQLKLGWLYSRGQGVSKDFSRAASWFRKAAEQGDRDALFRLGLCYENGKGVPEDRAAAAKCYRKALKQGNPEAGAG